MSDRADQANAYMKDKMLFTPRMFKTINQLAPEVGERFADFYESVWADGNLPRKIKELMFVSIGVAYMSPRCIVHVVPAVEAGAQDGVGGPCRDLHGRRQGAPAARDSDPTAGG